MMERKLSLFFYLLAPIFIIAVYFYSANTMVTWGNYASLDLRLYDLWAPGIFSIILLFITMQLTILRIVGERAPYGTLDRELVSISRISLYFGKLIANLMFVLIQTILVYFAGYILFPAKNYGDISIIFLFLLLIGLFGSILGLTISILSKNREQAIQLVPFFVLILLLLSGVFIKLDQMPETMRSIASNLPLTLGVTSLERVILNGNGFEDVSSNFVKLSLWTFIILLIGLLKFRFENEI